MTCAEYAVVVGAGHRGDGHLVAARGEGVGEAGRHGHRQIGIRGAVGEQHPCRRGTRTLARPGERVPVAPGRGIHLGTGAEQRLGEIAQGPYVVGAGQTDESVDRGRRVRARGPEMVAAQHRESREMPARGVPHHDDLARRDAGVPGPLQGEADRAEHVGDRLGEARAGFDRPMGGVDGGHARRGEVLGQRRETRTVRVCHAPPGTSTTTRAAATRVGR
jgi:hypothetical protein